jgi:hypothetical protein
VGWKPIHIKTDILKFMRRKDSYKTGRSSKSTVNGTSEELNP